MNVHRLATASSKMQLRDFFSRMASAAKQKLISNLFQFVEEIP